MQRSGMVGKVARAPRYGALAIALLATAALAGTAASSQGSSAAGRAATVGTSYGGVTSQDLPVIVDVNRRRSRVARAVIAIRMNCSAGGFTVFPDRYTRMAIRRREFSASFGPIAQRNPDGTTTDFEGTISGTFNSKRTKVSGTWVFKATYRDAAGAVTDICDSGSVGWSAKQ